MERIEVLQKEHDRVGTAITNQYLSLDRLLGLGLLVFGATSALARTRISPILIPVILAVISFYALDILHEIMMAGGYKRHLERSINRELDDPSLLWEGWISKSIAQRGAGKKLLFTLYTATVIAASVVSIVAALRYEGDYVGPIKYGALLFWIVYWFAAIVAALEGFGAADLVEAWSAEARTETLGTRDEAFLAWRRSQTWFGLWLKPGR